MEELVVGVNLEVISASDATQAFEVALRKDPNVIVICAREKADVALKFAEQAFLSGHDVQLTSTVENTPENIEWLMGNSNLQPEASN
ncbi:hypothetical protein L1D14_03760 [Vibrio tubiashii]|uniref:hypothetical protein n=1 Tax=Vibrio tubiashii TaxID=29498 RepID=UPI001EFD607D|nr:hypothetical protein [Vibrio tubiashii]MCG9575346.1 hypothetical protein [Vibrio tubiashii]